MTEMHLIQGDCLKVLPEIPSESVDLVVTDPPYGINFQSNARKNKFDKLFNDDNIIWYSPFLKEIYRILKNNTHFYLFTRWDVYPKIFHLISNTGFNIKNVIITPRKSRSMGDLYGQFAPSYEMIIFSHKGRRKFRKTNIPKNPNSHSRFRGDTSMFDFKTRFDDLLINYSANEIRYRLLHPTQKDKELIKLFIMLSSNEKEVVLDPFLGSGTTMKACLELNRSCIGIELEPKYIQTIKERLNWGSSLNPDIKWRFEAAL